MRWKEPNDTVAMLSEMIVRPGMKYGIDFEHVSYTEQRESQQQRDC